MTATRVIQAPVLVSRWETVRPTSPAVRELSAEVERLKEEMSALGDGSAAEAQDAREREEARQLPKG